MKTFLLEHMYHATDQTLHVVGTGGGEGVDPHWITLEKIDVDPAEYLRLVERHWAHEPEEADGQLVLKLTFQGRSWASHHHGPPSVPPLTPEEIEESREKQKRFLPHWGWPR